MQCNIAGRDLGSVVADIQRAVRGAVTLEPGYFIEYGGQFESQQQATRLIGMLSLLSILLIFGVLYGHFRSPRLALQVMVNIPLAVIGGVVAIFLSGGTLSVASLVGFITRRRHRARNGIMMLSHYLHLMDHEGEKFDREDDRAGIARAAGAGADDRADRGARAACRWRWPAASRERKSSIPSPWSSLAGW